MFKGDKKQKKQTSGITLVALVVTIVVLLILAGITITMLFSDSGIINKAREAADATKNAQSDTEKGLSDLEGDMGEALGEATPIAKAIEKGEDFAKDRNKRVQDENGDILTIPQGYTIVTQEMDDTVDCEKVTDDEYNESNKYPTVKAGIVITDSVTTEENGTTKSNGNQFVWVPVPNPSEMYKENNGNYEGKLYDFSWANNKLTATEKTNYGVGTTSYREPDILDNNSYDANQTYLDQVVEEKYKTGETKTKENFKKQLQDEFKAMIESVKKYGGFYIGRYETSLDSTTGSKVQSKANQTSFYNNDANSNWYVQYKYNKEFAQKSNNNLSVVSSTIWGSQYDAMMKWMGSNGIDVTNATPTADAERNTDKTDRKTGSEENDKLCNIYDLLGNSYEWTMEANLTSFRVSRGGYSSYSYSPSNRGSSCPTSTNGCHSSRLSLYVKL